jgi:hypothetical protein
MPAIRLRIVIPLATVATLVLPGTALAALAHVVAPGESLSLIRTVADVVLHCIHHVGERIGAPG